MKLNDYELLYDLPEGEYDGAGIRGVRTVTIRAGASLEVMCHPLLIQWPEGAKREAKRRKTGEKQAAINARNLERQIMRLAEANFHHLKAVILTGTYEYPNADDVGMMNIDDVWKDWHARKLPEGVEDVRRDVRNMLGRIRRRMSSKGQDDRGLRWILRIEEDDKLDAFGLPTRYHIHMLIEAEGLSQSEIADEWRFGFTRCDRFDLVHDGAARIAHYITKNKRGGRWVSHSRNLKKPVERVSDRKVSRRRLQRIAEDVRRDGRLILEKLYPGYRVQGEITVRYSDYMPGAYIYCRMRRLD